MGLFDKLAIDTKITPSIDWDLLPAETFTIFESWGTKIRDINPRERFYYFFIDGWGAPPSLHLMERGIKHARVLARIDAPQELIDQAVRDEGKSHSLDRNYAINDTLKKWLKANVIDSSHDPRVTPFVAQQEEPQENITLPEANTPLPTNLSTVSLPNKGRHVQEEDIPGIVKNNNFYDAIRNPKGIFNNFLVDNGNDLTTDKTTGLMWQRHGLDITSIRKMRKNVERLNKEKYAGFSDWRLPTMEEALSLMQPEKNRNDLHLDPAFSGDIPFIFVAEERDPGGYWFCDYKRGSVFWASGTIPGGFGRVCRTA
ncbi:MAG: DUF1566 domain-containing protein [Proteobacteria bacterium]|nr:DUF1566 domain-containing protein [Pseudomonadota bacterium]MBU1639735.1 DUF1566 domain-containing protein [Pseudomonadota bacterium]